MPLDLNCPKCRHVFPVTEARHPVGVQCPGCDAELTAEFRRLPVPQPGESAYELLVSVGRPPGSPPLVPSGGKAMKLDEEEKERHGGGMGTVIAAGLGALVVTLAGLGATGYFLFTHLDVEETSYSSSSPRSNNSGGRQNNNQNNNSNSFGPGIPGTPGQPKKIDRFDLKPESGILPPITPVTLPADPAVIDLSDAGGKVGALAVGGGGRYIVMHFPQKGLLGVFDASKGQMVAGVPADSGNDVKVAAGATRAVLAAPGNVLRVYSLPDLRKEFDASSPMEGVKSIAMGSRTNGPILLTGWPGGKLVLANLNANSITEVEGSRGEPGHHWDMLRAAPDGTAFTTFDRFDPGNKVKLLTEFGGKWKLKDLEQVPFPGVDKYLYGNGVISDRNGTGKSIGVGLNSNNWVVPSTTGSYFLKVVPGTAPGKGPQRKSVTVTIHTNRNDTPVRNAPVFTDLGETAGLLDPFGNPVQPLDQHLFLIPEAKLLVVLNRDRNKLTLRKVDVR
jgi:hypothetical protein